MKILVAATLLILLFEGRLSAQEDVADIKSEDLRADNDEKRRYFLVGPHKGVTAPKQGYGLLVVLPGGDGSAEFHPFVKRIYKNAVPEGYILAQPVAVKWSQMQQIVWPTDKNRVAGMMFSTEEFVGAVIKDVGGRHQLDPDRIFTLTWSSSGPAAYAVSLTQKEVTGSFIAMSVFKPDLLPSLEKAKGHGYFIYHSPDDRVCPFRMAEQAAKDLEKSGATVKLATYAGGHGWRGPLYDHIREGVQWLEKNHACAVSSGMKTRIVPIGNSWGIRIPKPLLEQTSLSGEVELSAEGDALVIRPVKKPRANWAAAFRKMAHRGDDTLLDDMAPSLSKWE